MSPRPRPHDHEASWAQELSRAQSPALERQAAFTEEKLRAEGHNLAEYRAEWAHFAAENPIGREAIHQQCIQATYLAYARIVDDLLRKETGAVPEERSEYCRRRGLYVEQLEQWRGDCEQAADLADARRETQTQAYRDQSKQLKDLQRELRRKEAALAETAALLTLRKKAAAIWGEEEDA